MADDRLMFVTDKGVKIFRSDILDSSSAGIIKHMRIIMVYAYDELPIKGIVEVLYLVKSDGTLYRWSDISNAYIRVLANDTDFDDAPHDGNAYVRQDGGWVRISATSADKNYVHELVGNVNSEFVVTHNLSKYPSVKVIDTAKTEFMCKIEHLDLNRTKIIMNKALPNGYVIFN